MTYHIRDVDMVITVGGDGTLLHTSHFIDDSVPVLGVNSDPTQAQEVAELSDHCDASRSTGHLCAATVENFEQVLEMLMWILFLAIRKLLLLLKSVDPYPFLQTEGVSFIKNPQFMSPFEYRKMVNF